MRLILWGLVCMVIAGVACKGKSKDQGYEFYYYPDKNVYYNTGNDQFYYSLNGGGIWDSVKNKSNNEPTILGEKILLTSNDSKIYKANQQHLKEYSGVAFDFASITTAGVPIVVTERKSQRKVAAVGVRKQPVEKPKKGISKFFSKLFGKK